MNMEKATMFLAAYLCAACGTSDSKMAALTSENDLQKVVGVSCNDKDYPGDHTVGIDRRSDDTFGVRWVTNLDVPGGFYHEEAFDAAGTVTTEEIHLLLKKNGQQAGRIDGAATGFTIDGTNYLCSIRLGLR